MRIVVFHRRPPQPSNTVIPESRRFIPIGFPKELSREQIKQVHNALFEPFANRRFTLSQPQSNSMRLRCQFTFWGHEADHTIDLPLSPWSYFSFWYRSGLSRIDTINECYIRNNAMVAGLQHELADVAGAVGRVLVVDDVALLYLRGRIDDIDGFENIEVMPHEHSTWTFARYSPKARDLLDAIQFQRDQVQEFCIYDKVERLEREVERLKEKLEQIGAKE